MKTNQENINKHPHHSPSEDEDRFGTGVPSPLDVHEDCAFGGAMSTLVTISDAAHLIHGPSGCMSNSWGSSSSFISDSMLHKVRFTTDMEESDIIFGGAEKLRKAIVQLVRRYQPSAVFVYSTCVSALIGDDINGVCKTASEQTKIPIIPVDSPGFTGRKNLGTRLAREALMEYVIGTAEPDFTTPYDINIIGEHNIAGAVGNMLPLLDKLGIRVLAKITGNAQYKEICYAHRAKLNVIISANGLLKMAKQMQDKFGIPYIESSFYGVEEISQCLRNIAVELGDVELQERTEKLIIEEAKVLESQLDFYKVKLQGKRVIIEINSFGSWWMVAAAKTLGMEVIPISNIKMNQEDKNRLKQWLDRDCIVLGNESLAEILPIISENNADLLIASDRLEAIALPAKIPFLNIKSELNHPCRAAQALYATIYSPIWTQVRQAAPWENLG